MGSALGPPTTSTFPQQSDGPASMVWHMVECVCLCRRWKRVLPSSRTDKQQSVYVKLCGMTALRLLL